MESSELRTIHVGVRFVVFRTQQGGRSVVVKTVRPDRLDPQSAVRLQAERAALLHLRMPGIVRLIAADELDGRPALILPDVGPTNLEEWLMRRPRLEVAAFLELAVQMAKIVAGMHGHNIIHRDLCPANFVLSEDGRVTLVDFELATQLPVVETGGAAREPPELPGRLEATLPYMAPEQTGRVKRPIDHRADLYALGATFYEMLVGTPPFPSKDPLEVIHGHLAQVPVPPSLVRRAIPPLLSEVVLKLLAKMPEWRYQSAEALEADLEELRQQWLAKGAVEPFELARLDRRELPFSGKLFGREPERAALEEALQRAQAGAREVVVLSGPAGAGKTALMDALRPDIERSALFVSGKCEQLLGNVPFAVFVDAIGALARQLRAAPELFATLQVRMQEACSPHGRVLTELVPELEPLLGEQPTLAPVGPMDAANRAELTWISFVSALARADRPLVMFLDDIQWMDTASLHLLARLGTDPELKHVLLVLAYRSEEVGPTHAAARAIDDVRRGGAQLVELKLGPLGVDALTALLADTLNTSPDQCRPLGELLARKTAGSPLFVRHLLRSLQTSGRLAFDATAGAWTWDLGRIAELEAPEDVADLLIATIRRLPPPVQEALTIAACIGSRFEVGLVAEVSSRTSAETARAFRSAARESIIVPAPGLFAGGQGVYRFPHDRVQQAAYALASKEQTEALHLEIGRTLFARSPERVFEVVDQLHRGRGLVVEPGERRWLLDLNERAAGLARASAAYDAALAYLRRAIDLLPTDAWSAQHELAMRLHQHAAEMAFVAASVDEAKGLVETALRHARSLAEQATLYHVCVSGHKRRLDFSEAVRWAERGLRLFGLEPPAGAPDALVERLEAEVERQLEGRSPEALLIAHRTTDPEQAALEDILRELLIINYTMDRQRWRVLTLWATRSVLEQHSHAMAVSAFMFFAMWLVTRGDYARARTFVSLSMDLSQARATITTDTTVGAATMKHWWVPLPEHISVLRARVSKQLEAGEFEWVSLGQQLIVRNMLAAGMELERILSIVDESLHLCRRTQYHYIIDQLLIARQAIRCLQGRTRERGGFDDADFDDEAFVERAKGGLARGLYAVARLQASQLLGDIHGALAWLEDAEKQLPFLLGAVEYVACVFHGALALLSTAEHAASPQRSALLARVTRLEDKLRTWAEVCPDNFGHKLELVSAERAKLEGFDAERLYHRAIEGAARSGFLQDEALALERCGRFCLARGQQRVAIHYLGAALDTYERWGAHAKVEILEDELAELDLPFRSRWKSPITRSGETAGLDQLTVFKAAETLSSEVELDRLLDKMMRICVEAAGARRGSLLVERDGQLRLEARFDAEHQRIELPHDARASSAVSDAIVRHSLRTGEDIVLGNAAQHGSFTRDPYVLAHACKSVLAMAVRHRDRVVAVLFLENDLSTNVFTADRLAVLRLLVAQAAISLENARLYDSVRASEALLRAFLEGMPVGVFVADGQGRAVFVNRRAVEIVGKEWDTRLSVEELPAANSLYVAGTDELYPPSRLPIVRALHGETWMAEDLEVRRPDRRVLLASWGTPIRGDNGSVRYAIVAFQDITARRAMEADRVRLETQLHQAQRLETVGRLAGGVAHDFNNLLTPILVNAELAAQALAPDSSARQMIHQIIYAAEQASGLTRQLLAFGRKQTLELRVLDLNELLRSFEGLFRRVMREDVEIRLSLDPKLAKVRADAAQLQRVFMNLGLNAADAMPRGGCITFETENLAPSSSVALRVRDTGHGMEQDMLANIFDPFFTTKALGKGTGLGLPTVHGVVAQHGGSIDVHSELGVGTTFEIILPWARDDDRSAPPLAAATAWEAPLGRGETLLLVEDDDAVRSVVETALLRDGYRVVATRSPVEALRLARTLGRELALVITDVVMPEMNGRELVARLRRDEPDVTALFMSGYAEDVAIEPFEGDSETEMLEKPLRLDSLRAKIRVLLEKTRVARTSSGQE